ncbi:hypothetical protein SDC9_60149 [bioreactor metagenome]|uniref:Uncharacterized protein n=1 Tax=bioreactor metagenome TaxID=1076179 RepID=A0A644XC46_9ZZZZ
MRAAGGNHLKENKLSIQRFWGYRDILVTAIFILALILLFTAFYLFAFVLIFLFCLILVLLFRKKSLKLLFIPITVLFLLSAGMNQAFSALVDTSQELVFHSQESIKTYLIPNSGIEVLPDEVQQVIHLAGKNHLKSFSLSEKFRQDETLYQRVSESVWPKRIYDQSLYKMILKEELIHYAGCSLIDEDQKVLLINCD